MQTIKFQYIKSFFSFAFSVIAFLPRMLYQVYKEVRLLQRQEKHNQEWFRQFKIQERLIQRRKWIAESEFEWKKF
jgi:hypothetical protein